MELLWQLVAAKTVATIFVVKTEQWEKYFDDGEQRILCDKGKGVCPNCHRLDTIDPLARYCRYCGAKLAKEAGHEIH